MLSAYWVLLQRDLARTTRSVCLTPINVTVDLCQAVSCQLSVVVKMVVCSHDIVIIISGLAHNIVIQKLQ